MRKTLNAILSPKEKAFIYRMKRRMNEATNLQDYKDYKTSIALVCRNALVNYRNQNEKEKLYNNKIN